MSGGLFPGIHVGMSEVHPSVKEDTSVFSQSQAWCSTSMAATSQYRFPLAENTSTTSTRDTAQNFSHVGQIQSTQTQTLDMLDMFTQSFHCMPQLMCDVGGEATSKKTIPQTGTSHIPTMGFPENMLLTPTATTLGPSVGGSDTSPFQEGGVPVPFTQQLSKGKSLQESLHEAGKELKP